MAEEESISCAGIHFGNTNSVISVFKDGRCNTVTNEDGIRFTPSIVAYTGDEKVVGLTAKQYMIKNAHCCVSRIKSALCLSYSDENCRELKSGCSCELVDENGFINYQVNFEQEEVEKEINVSPGTAASFVFTKLLENAELIGGEDLEDVVVAVPKAFTQNQRDTLKEAVESIGFNVLRFISEPAAAVLAYGIGQEENTISSNCLVFRLGGSSMSASLVQVNSGMYRIVAEKHDSKFGSNLFDEKLVGVVCKEFQKKYKADMRESKRSLNKLRAAMEITKIGLSSSQAQNIYLDSIYEGIDFNTKITRGKFESECTDLFQQLNRFVEELLSESSMSVQYIEKVVLAGGGCHMPKIQQILKEKFSQSEILSHISPQEVIAEGAAIQAGLLQGKDNLKITDQMCQFECVSTNIGIEVVDEEGNPKLDVIFPKHTPIPAKKSRFFKIPQSQGSVALRLLESDTSDIKDATFIRKLELDFDWILVEATEKFRDIQCSFDITRTGSLMISMTDKESERTQNISIDFEAG